MIETPRLIVRAWVDADRAPWRAMCADPRVMATIGATYGGRRADADVDALIARGLRQGHVFWALERREDRRFLGFCGLEIGDEGLPIAGLPEIGWRLAFDAWGQGYAREAAAACLDWAWRATAWPAVWAITTPANTRSWGLMERLGMVRDATRDFDDPAVPVGDPLRAHWTWVIRRAATRPPA